MKTIQSFSIEVDIALKFDEYCRNNNNKKSVLIQEWIMNFLKMKETENENKENETKELNLKDKNPDDNNISN